MPRPETNLSHLDEPIDRANFVPPGTRSRSFGETFCSVRGTGIRARILSVLFILVFFIPVTLFTGCGGSKPKDEPVLPAAGPSVEEANTEVASSSEEGVPPPSNETGATILKAMVDLYSRAKIYSDNAYLETVYEVNANGHKRMVSDRFPCSITIQKPNQVRMEVNTGLLVSNGKKLQGVIHEPGYQSQYLDREAPLLISAIKDLYPDARLAGAMDMGVPSNILWVPPQAVLLLSKAPLRTFIPIGSEITLGDPAWIVRGKKSSGMPNRILCDRVLITSDDGTRTLWIDRDNHHLVRFEFPLERIAVPRNVEKVARLSIEFPEILLSDDAQTTTLDEKTFSLPGNDTMERVDRFESVPLLIVGKAAPPFVLRPLVSGFTDIRLNESNETTRPRVVCLWKGAPGTIGDEPDSHLPDPTNPDTAGRPQTATNDYKTFTRMTSDVWAENKKFLSDLQGARQYFPERDKLDFIAINVDSLTERDDAMVRGQYGELATDAILYRLRTPGKISLEAQNNIPALLLIDAKGVVQRYYRAPLSLSRLDRDFHALANGDELWKEELSQFNARSAQFDASLARADLSDCYATAQEQTTEDEIEILPKTAPTAFDLTQLWTVETLRSPGNPVVLPSETDLSESVVVVPCEGNSLAMIDRTGTILKRVAPKAAQGEPITFVRVAGTREHGSLAASAAGSSRKVHRLTPSFDDLGSLDVGQPRGQWVADFCFIPSDDSEHPGLVISLVGDTMSNAIPVDGVYAIDFRKQNILWKDESLRSPTCMTLSSWSESREMSENPGQGNTNDESANGNSADERSLLVLDRGQGSTVNLLELNRNDGQRIQNIQLKKENILYAKGKPSRKDTQGHLETDETVAVLLEQPETDREYVAGLSRDGAILWRVALPDQASRRQLEPIVCGDINGDSLSEWIILSSNGTLLLLNERGEQLDRFQYGSEVTGLCVAHWGDGQTALVITDPDRITAWSISGKKSPVNEENHQPVSNEELERTDTK